MASKVNRWTVSVEDFLLLSRRYLRNLLTRAFWPAPLFSPTGLQPRGCTKPLIRLKADRSLAGTSWLQTRWSAPSKIRRSPRRLFKAARSRSPERSEFGSSSTRGQPRGKVVMVRSYGLEAEPRRGPIKATRSGTLAHECFAGSWSPTSGFSQHSGSRSSLACLRSAVWLPGTVGQALLGCGHR
jgi:hypothetical protein